MVKPGVGLMVECIPDKRTSLIEEIEQDQKLQLILTPGQRQQLICFLLLVETEPVILTQIRVLLKVSRTTIIKDLDEIEVWLSDWGIDLERKQNYGIWIASPEKHRQQVLMALLWGAAPFGPSLFEISFQNGLVFSLEDDVEFLPLVEMINNILETFDFHKIFNKVIFVEDFLGGRFTDDAVLFLALFFSVLVARIKMGQHLDIPEQEITLLKEIPIWQAAVNMANSLSEGNQLPWTESDIAYIAMNILAAPRSESWAGELDQESHYKELFADLLEHISQAYQISELRTDPTLRDGLVNHLIPVCNQHIFQLWFPKMQLGLPEEKKYKKEHSVAQKLGEIIHDHTAIEIPPEETFMIAALLRAAYIRSQPHQLKQVLVICPSGMATAQLLTARLNTRFPRLGKLTVMSYRALDEKIIESADLIITLMPLSKELVKNKPMIQVSPQLLPEDVEAITSFLD